MCTNNSQPDAEQAYGNFCKLQTDFALLLTHTPGTKSDIHDPALIGSPFRSATHVQVCCTNERTVAPAAHQQTSKSVQGAMQH